MKPLSASNKIKDLDSTINSNPVKSAVTFQTALVLSAVFFLKGLETINLFFYKVFFGTKAFL